MTDNERKLLEEHGVLVLPDLIEHDVFTLALTACLILPDKPIKIYCLGSGGDAMAARGIIDVIQHHGHVIGILPGAANSAHGLIFAACSQRYVYPGGALGVHRCLLSQITDVDAKYAQNWHSEFESLDRAAAKTLSEACADQKKLSETYWYRVIDKQGSSGLTRFDAAFLIASGMAKPISEMPA